MKHVWLLILSAFCSAQAWALGGSVPTGYPSSFMMGYVFEAHVDSAGRYVAAGSEFNTVDHYMAAISSGWSASYKYLIGGPRAANDPNCWWNAYPGNGAMPTNFMNQVNGHGWQPIFIYENLQKLSGNYAGGIYGAFNNATFMGQYFSDWADLMTVVNNWLTANAGKVVTIDVEPDSWGYMQQNYNSNPALITANVASATNPGGAYPWVPISQFPNTVQGAARALLYIKDVRVSAANRSRLKLAFHASSWAVSPNPATSQSAVNVATHASSVAGFVNACKTTVTAGTGSDWDLLFLDPADGDAGLYSTNSLDAGGTTHWWDPNNAAQPTFDRYRDWVNELSNDSNLRAMLWQMPIGNQVYKTEANTHGHYQDNKAEYFLNATNGTAHICDWAANGVIGILWGRGSIIPVGAAFTEGTGGPDYWSITWATDYSGGTQDNITNAGATGSTATVADDDGGYLRSRMPAYFSSPCTLPGLGTPTPSATRTPNFSPTISPTFTQTPVCPGAYVDGLEDNNSTNQWGGTWSDYNPGAGSTMSPATFAPTAGGAGTGAYCARISGSVTGANYPSLSTFLNAGQTAVNVCAYNALSFQFNGSAGVQYRVQIHSSQEDPGNYNDYFYNLMGTGSWQTIVVPYSSLQPPGWGPAYTLDCAQWRYISWLPLQAGAYDLSVDEVQFLCLVATPTPTVSSTRTPSASPSITPSVTPSKSASPSSTVSPSFSPSPTQSASPTASVTRSGTPTATPSPTPSASFSSSPTRTASASETPSTTASSTRSASPTATSTVTASVTRTAMGTATPSPSFSASPTVAVGSATNTPTLSPTRTSSPSSTPSATLAVGSATASATTTATRTVSTSATRSATATLSSSASPSITQTETVAIGSPTATRTATASWTASPTLSSSPSPLPPTLTATVTAVLPSPTATPTATFSPSFSASPTPRLGSATPSSSATRTSSPTLTLTATPSLSLSSSVTPGGAATTATFTALPMASGDGPNEILEAVAWPQPNPLQLRLKLAGPSDRIRVQVFTRGYVVVGTCEGSGTTSAGWTVAALPDLKGLPAGAYYFRVQSLRNGQADLGHKAGRLILLR
jgi:hypothetical protein